MMLLVVYITLYDSKNLKRGIGIKSEKMQTR